MVLEIHVIGAIAHGIGKENRDGVFRHHFTQGFAPRFVKLAGQIVS